MHRRADPLWMSAEDTECVDMCLAVLEGCALQYVSLKTSAQKSILKCNASWPKATQFIADIQELASCYYHSDATQFPSSPSSSHASASLSLSGWVTEAVRDAEYTSSESLSLSGDH